MSQGIERTGPDGIRYYARRNGAEIIVVCVDRSQSRVDPTAARIVAQEMLGEHEQINPLATHRFEFRMTYKVELKPAAKFVPLEWSRARIDLRPGMVSAIELDVLPGEDEGVFYVGRNAATRILELWKHRFLGGRRAYHFTSGRDIVFVDSPGGQIEINEWPESYGEDLYRLDASPFPNATVTPL